METQCSSKGWSEFSVIESSHRKTPYIGGPSKMSVKDSDSKSAILITLGKLMDHQKTSSIWDNPIPDKGQLRQKAAIQWGNRMGSNQKEHLDWNWKKRSLISRASAS